MAIMMVVSAGVMWAGSGLGAQNVYEKSSINAMELTAFRMIMAGIILLGMTVWEGKFKSSMKAMNEHKLLWLDVLIYAVVGLMLMHYTYFEAIAYGDAPTATVILYSCPAMVVCYQAIREHHLPSETKMFTTFLAVFGTFLLMTGGNPATLNVSVICILLSLLNGVIYSFNEARETGLDLFASPIINELADLDVMSKTPIEAMEILFRLSKEAKESR